MITPYDINLVLDGSETRRKFIDALISQFNKNYLNELIQYNKLIQQRNSILKGMKGSSSINDLLDIYEIQIIQKSKIIFERRNSFIKEFSPIFDKYYQ
jgi:DNA replication and repair protein RecF